MDVLKIDAEDWRKNYAEAAHLIGFDESRPAQKDRIDFALLGVEADRVYGYLTCKEHDAETVYVQFGAAMPGTKGTVAVQKAFRAGLGWLEKRYKRMWFWVENTNLGMLRLALYNGFLVIGTRNFHGKVLVELEREK